MHLSVDALEKDVAVEKQLLRRNKKSAM